MAIPVVLVGLGVRGRQWGREVSRSSSLSLVAACDPSPEARARAVADGMPADCLRETPAEALGAPGARAAIVATPVDAHVAPCTMALERDLGVLVEKPFALSVAEARSLVELARSRGRPLLVGQNQRYLRMFRATKAVLDGGALGPLVFVDVSAYREGHPPVAGLGRISLAALWEAGIHHLDALRYLLGDRVVGVTAAVTTAPWSADLRGTTCSATLEFAGGPLVSYRLCWDSRGHGVFEQGQQFVARFVGEHGTLHVLQRWLVLCRRGRWPTLVRRGPRPITEEAVLLRQFEAAIVDGTAAEVSGEDNLRTVALAEACERSVRYGCRVDPRSILADA